jgi:hypothetical protein
MKKAAVVRKFASLAFLLACLSLVPALRADEQDQAVRVTFSQAVQIPGQVLPAGTYWFVLPRDGSQHFVVRIFNAERTKLCATLLTVSAERSRATENTVFMLAGQKSTQPQAIMSWFYAGNTIGHEFLYTKHVQKQLAQETHATLVAQK